MHLYKQPSGLNGLVLRKRIKEYAILRKMGLRAEKSRCKNSKCGKYIKISEFINGKIFCSDECMNINNNNTREYYIRLYLETGYYRTNCIRCNYEYTISDYLEDRDDYKFCSDECSRYYVVEDIHRNYYDNIKLGIKKNPQCTWCHRSIPRSGSISNSLFCSEECHDDYIALYMENFNPLLYKVCEDCGNEFEAKSHTASKCISCSYTVPIGFDFKLIDEVSSFWLGVFYNIAEYEYTNITLYSNRKALLETVRSKLGIDSNVGNTIDGAHSLKIVGGLVNILYDYGLVRNFLERDLPAIPEGMLSYFYYGLLYSSDVESDGINKYYPIVSRDVCIYLSEHFGMPYVYHKGNWCVYEPVTEYDDIDLDSFDIEYPEALIEPELPTFGITKNPNIGVDVIDKINMAGMRDKFRLGHYDIVVSKSESSINGKSFSIQQSTTLKILYHYIGRAIHKNELVRALDMKATNASFTKMISRLRKVIDDSGYEIVSIYGGYLMLQKNI